jgi:predicted transposase YbfD/YdcC
MSDYHAILGRCPQTTTAMSTQDVERTRRLLKLSHSKGSAVDRFSIITLKMLHQVHAGFTPEELLRVECIPQNKEAADRFRKANAGRARRHVEKKAGAMMPNGEEASTIACVSGFLFNMMDRSVRLVTPCCASDRWPLGYWVLDHGRFDSARELRQLLDGMIERNMRSMLRADDRVKLREGVKCEVEGDDLVLRSHWIKTSLHGRADVEHMAEALNAGRHTAAELAFERSERFGIPMEETFLLLLEAFKKAYLDEEPVRRFAPHAAAETATA